MRGLSIVALGVVALSHHTACYLTAPKVENFGDSPADVLKWTKERETVSKEKSTKVKGKAMGEWDSPITSRNVACETLELSEPRWDGEDLYWLEYRPMEARQVVMRRSAEGIVVAVTPEGRSWDVRTLSGSPYTVKGGVVYFNNAVDGALYTQFAAFPVDPVPLTPAGGAGFSDPDVDPARERLLCVRREPDGGSSLVSVSLEDSGGSAPAAPVVIQASNKALASPSVSPDLRRLAWVEGSQVWAASLTDAGEVTDAKSVADKASHPAWSALAVLHYATEASGRRNLMEEGVAEPMIASLPEGGEVASGGGTPPYAFNLDGSLLCAVTSGAGQIIVNIDPVTKATSPLGKGGLVAAAGVCVSQNGAVCAVTAGRRGLKGLGVLKGEEFAEVRGSCEAKPRAIYASEPKMVEFNGEGGLPGRMAYYPPRNDRYAVGLGELAPLLLFTSGVETTNARSGTGFGGGDLDAWFWTSRGFAVAAMPAPVGAEERRAVSAASPETMASHLAAAAKHLADAGDADPEAMVIVGFGKGAAHAAAALGKGTPFAAGACLWGEGSMGAPSVTRPFAVIRDKGKENGVALHAAAKAADLLCLNIELPKARGGLDKSTALDGLLLFVARSLRVAAPIPSDLDDEAIRLDNFDPLIPGEPRSYVVIDGYELEIGRESLEIRELGYTPVPNMAYFPEERPDRPSGTDMDQETEKINPLSQIEWL